MTIAPWLQAPDVLKIIDSGVRAGLAARKQASDELESADRLSLAYAQLASQESQKNEETQARLEDARARREQARSTAASLENYRQQQLAQRNAAMALTAANQKRQAEQFAAGQEATQGRFETAQRGLDERFTINALMRQAHEKRLAELNKAKADEFAKREQRIMGMAMDPVQRTLMGLDVADLRNVKKRLAEFDEAGGPSWTLLPPSRKQFREYDKLTKEKKELEDKIKSYKSITETPAVGGGGGEKQLTADLAKRFLEEAKGDKEVARKLAKAAGYTF